MAIRTSKFLALFCFLIIICTSFPYNYVQYDFAFSWVGYYFTLPVLCILFFLSLKSYKEFVGNRKIKKSNFFGNKIIQKSFFISSFTIGLGLVVLGACFSSILFTGAFFNESEIRVVGLKVIQYENTARGSHFLTVERVDGEIHKLEVDKEYQVGDYLNKTYRIGRWGEFYE